MDSHSICGSIRILILFDAKPRDSRFFWFALDLQISVSKKHIQIPLDSLKCKSCELWFCLIRESIDSVDAILRIQWILDTLDSQNCESANWIRYKSMQYIWIRGIRRCESLDPQITDDLSIRVIVGGVEYEGSSNTISKERCFGVVKWRST